MVSAVPPCELLLMVLLERVRDVSEQVSWLARDPRSAVCDSLKAAAASRRGRLMGISPEGCLLAVLTAQQPACLHAALITDNNWLSGRATDAGHACRRWRLEALKELMVPISQAGRAAGHCSRIKCRSPYPAGAARRFPGAGRQQEDHL